ncbi:MBL fold metallo-hydrolase [Pseudohalioglobus lutimaris]|uniref:MBL fold metallo-hydrolase n=1 Tax=Pseudohalioglobus lutimaris TaxID=1737061 RepID=A0A2N5X1I3_9GAMM|nr:MBL fold metallo-hydrolase [Pseudohalioglobus lutimaris]PLW68354.1 MBL fold metallo-hydrolase [Pseudohalioglobus lutimaris]
MSIQCTIVPVTPYQQNCSVIKCQATGKAAIVDPGGDVERILEAVAKMEATVEKIILTHAHMDHCAAADVIRQQLKVPIEGPHKADEFWLEKLPEWCQMSGFPHADAFVPDRWLDDNETVSVGAQTLQVVHCPGHTPGHVVFYYQPQNVAWVGDVIFQGSIGRTDFPKGNHDDLVASIREKLFPLGDDITFIPGHGPTSTFGQERRSNPFVADARYG